MKIIIFIIFFFLFNTLHIDSNSTKRLIYNVTDLYDVKYNTIYFVDVNSNDLSNLVNSLNLEITTYIVNDKKYYVRNIEELLDEYTQNKSLEEKLFDRINGIKIDGIKLKCSNEELLEIEKWFKIY